MLLPYFDLALGRTGIRSTHYMPIEFRMHRVPTRPGKPGKMRVHLENLEISWNFEKFNKYHGKMT